MNSCLCHRLFDDSFDDVISSQFTVNILTLFECANCENNIDISNTSILSIYKD